MLKVSSAQLQLRDNGVYYTDIYANGGARRIRQSLGFQKGEEAQARAALTAVVEQLQAGHQIQLTTGVLTVQDWGASWTATRKAAGKLEATNDEARLRDHFYPCVSAKGIPFAAILSPTCSCACRATPRRGSTSPCRNTGAGPDPSRRPEQVGGGLEPIETATRACDARDCRPAKRFRDSRGTISPDG